MLGSSSTARMRALTRRGGLRSASGRRDTVRGLRRRGRPGGSVSRRGGARCPARPARDPSSSAAGDSSGGLGPRPAGPGVPLRGSSERRTRSSGGVRSTARSNGAQHREAQARVRHLDRSPSDGSTSSPTCSRAGCPSTAAASRASVPSAVPPCSAPGGVEEAGELTEQHVEARHLVPQRLEILRRTRLAPCHRQPRESFSWSTSTFRRQRVERIAQVVGQAVHQPGGARPSARRRATSLGAGRRDVAARRARVGVAVTVWSGRTRFWRSPSTRIR